MSNANVENTQATFVDVSYGTHERHVLDVYLCEKAKQGLKTPVVIYLHGGGYLHGDKREINPMLYKAAMQANITVISCNYRFISELPFPAPMEDGARAIQFVKSKADEWYIDPDKIALAGGSAGAHISLWNAFKGDLSDPNSSDPIARIPTNVQAAIVFNSQVSKDQHFYKDIYLGDKIQPNLTLFYGVDSVEELESTKVRQLSYEASAINFLTKDAPPVLLHYKIPFTEPIIPADAPVGDVIHHPMHGYVLKQKMDEMGIRCELRHGNDPVTSQEITAFLKSELNWQG